LIETIDEVLDLWLLVSRRRYLIDLHAGIIGDVESTMMSVGAQKPVALEIIVEHHWRRMPVGENRERSLRVKAARKHTMCAVLLLRIRQDP
jgi:hypothetical protein